MSSLKDKLFPHSNEHSYPYGLRLNLKRPSKFNDSYYQPKSDGGEKMSDSVIIKSEPPDVDTNTTVQNLSHSQGYLFPNSVTENCFYNPVQVRGDKKLNAQHQNQTMTSFLEQQSSSNPIVNEPMPISLASLKTEPEDTTIDTYVPPVDPWSEFTASHGQSIFCFPDHPDPFLSQQMCYINKSEVHTTPEKSQAGFKGSVPVIPEGSITLDSILTRSMSPSPPSKRFKSDDFREDNVSSVGSSLYRNFSAASSPTLSLETTVSCFSPESTVSDSLSHSEPSAMEMDTHWQTASPISTTALITHNMSQAGSSLPKASTSQNGPSVEPTSSSVNESTTKAAFVSLIGGYMTSSAAANSSLRHLLSLSPLMMPILNKIDDQPRPIRFVNLEEMELLLKTMKEKLSVEGYSDPWEFINEFWTLINATKAVNKKHSLAYAFCVQIGTMFESDVNKVMKDFGYCCGTQYILDPKPITCAGKDGCLILVHDNYFYYKDWNLSYCTNCFNNYSELIEFDDEEKSSVLKSKFSLLKNDKSEMEPMIKCVNCDKNYHLICVRHVPKFSHEFICKTCQPQTPVPPRAKDLPTTTLSRFVQKRVHTFLTKNEIHVDVHIRVVASNKKSVAISPEMGTRLGISETLPYTTKSMFAFVEMDGEDVCFFGVHVQEFGSECPPPNTGRVYISYLDSVNYFKPKKFRTQVYQQILFGYLAYVKRLGYKYGHIWACPARQAASDYLFHAHPPDQKMPTVERLRKWYLKLLTLGQDDGIVMKFKNIVEYAKETNMSSVSQMPFFEGDHWPLKIQNLFEAERNCKGLTPTPGKGKKGTKTQRPKKKKETKNKKVIPRTGDSLWDAVRDEMEEYKRVFFVAWLNHEMKPIQDPDVVIPCELMEDRDKFVDISKKNHYEFSSLRRAKYSTRAIVYEVLDRIGGINFENMGEDEVDVVGDEVDGMEPESNDLVEVEGHATNVNENSPVPTTAAGITFDGSLEVGNSQNGESIFPARGTPEIIGGTSRNGEEDQKDIKPILPLPKPTKLEQRKMYLDALVHTTKCGKLCGNLECAKIKLNWEHQSKCDQVECRYCEMFFKLIRLHIKDCKEGKLCPVKFCYVG